MFQLHPTTSTRLFVHNVDSRLKRGVDLGARLLMFPGVSDDTRIQVALYNRKANMGAIKPPVGFEIAFTSERTNFSKCKHKTI